MNKGFAVLLILCACRQEPPPVQSSGVVDSIFPVEEEIRRFKSGLPDSLPTTLTSNHQTKDDLAIAFVEALEKNDTIQLRALVVTAGEFIELHYPHSEYTAPPYRQSPAALWFLLQQNSEKGIARALSRFGGRPAGYRTLECENPSRQLGPVTLWPGCRIRWRAADGKPDPIVLFGTILQHGDRYKFLSYANDL